MRLRSMAAVEGSSSNAVSVDVGVDTLVGFQPTFWDRGPQKAQVCPLLAMQPHDRYLV